MVRKRTKSKPIQLGKKEEMMYQEACRIAKACDNLPPLKEDFVKNE